MFRVTGLISCRRLIFQPLPAPPGTDLSGPYQISDLRDYSIAVSGDVFRWIIDYASQEVLHRVRAYDPCIAEPV